MYAVPSVLRLSGPRVKQRVKMFWCVLRVTLGNSSSANEPVEVGNFLNNEDEALHRVIPNQITQLHENRESRLNI